MTKKRLAFWQDYVNTIASMLDCKDWTLIVHDGPGVEGSLASISFVPGRKFAWIALCESWEDLSPEEHRHTIAHEVLHVHTNGIRTVFWNLCEGSGKTWMNMAKLPFSEQLEFATDGIATAIQGMFPLPKKVK